MMMNACMSRRSWRMPLFSLQDVYKRQALDLSETRGPSALQDKIVTVSSVANAGHEPMFAAYQALLPFVRTQVVGDFTGTTVNPEAWATGELVLTDEAFAGLEKQAQALLEA